MKKLSVFILLFLSTEALAGNGDLVVDGKLGVGTPSPQRVVEVHGASGNLLALASITNTGAANTGAAIIFEGGDGLVTGRSLAEVRALKENSTVGNYASFLSFYTRVNGALPVERLRIDSAGNVGIGTQTPATSRRLHVYNPNSSIVANFQSNTTTSYIGFQDTGTTDNTYVRLGSNGNNMIMYAGGAEKMRITTTGNVGIGTGSPASKLHVVVPTVGDASLSLQRDSSSRFDFVQGIVGVTGDSLLIKDASLSRDYIMLRDGKIGIGKTNPAQQLDVGGSIAVNGNIVHSSDAKFKKDLLSIDSPLEKILSLNGLSYKWKIEEFQDKGFPEGRHYGVIAQEIEKVLPEVVNTAPDGTKAVAYTEIIPVLIEAIKEQQKIIEKQQERIGRLEQRLETPFSKIEREVE